MPIRRILNLTGRLLVAAGLLVLLFTAYQLWGTGILEARSQSTLRAEITAELPPGALDRAAATADGRGAGASGGYVVGDQPAAPRPVPAQGQPVGVINIPAISIDQVVVEGIGTDDLQMGPGHYPGTPLPGEPGNAAIAGHRTTYGHPFYDLNELVRGDRIVITTPQGIFLYRVTNVVVVLPTQTEVLAPSAKPLLTLTTCNPRYSATQRLVVRAALARSLLFAGQHPVALDQPASRPRSTDLAGEVGHTSWPAAVGWGLLTLAAALLTWLLARRVRRRWLVYTAGGIVVLVVLFVFFAAVSPLLPASF